MNNEIIVLLYNRTIESYYQEKVVRVTRRET